MARLENMLPPGEIVRWKSRKVVRPRRIAGWGAAYVALCGLTLVMFATVAGPDRAFVPALSFAGIGLLILAMELLFVSKSEAAVTEGHVVWVRGAVLSGRNRGTVRLRDIHAVDLEEGGEAANLHCEGETHRIEMVKGSDLGAMARAIDQPARIWRKCISPVVRRAKGWQMFFAATVGGITAAGTVALAFPMLGGDGRGPLIGAIIGAAGAIFAQVFADMAKRTLPHLLVGRRLSVEARRDFVGWMTDLRWQGVKPEGPGDDRLPRSRLQDWAMRMAYGEIPDIGEREPEILIPGAFPPDCAAADTT